ncbi:TlpA family protein disulfide reductase [Nonlabens marinus]|uniref:Thioredoxin domain-containing protein n=1 Tax=Nonlabens marinus S1-08 TaxID=1454201 RepID=W8VZK4_9FLAO|nr:hypothetical protein [Nonlabens marinus]BAO54731.1 hypothetical protein NMS_0722 [Nonlabens marinus S1-08]
MKNSLILVFLFILLSCKEESKQPLRFADVDTSSNEIIHLTDGEDIYYSMEDLLAMHEGKVVYVHFWNSFTSKDKMRSVELLEKKYADKDFVILNIGTDTAMMPFEMHLEITTLENNYLARNFEQAAFFKEREFYVIPRYMLYDKQGNLLDDNAMSPDNPDLDTTLQTLLDQ